MVCVVRWLIACCLGLRIAGLLIVLVLPLPRYNICLRFCYVVYVCVVCWISCFVR